MKLDFNKGSPWRTEKIVLPQHADHAGVMWHGAYISWLEESRVDALQKAGLNYYELSATGIEMPVVSLTIDYKNELKHGDRVVLNSWFLGKQGVRFTWLSSFILQDSDLLAAKAKVELVLVDRSAKKLKLIKNTPTYLQVVFERLRKEAD